jgi:hypothetical protein
VSHAIVTVLAGVMLLAPGAGAIVAKVKPLKLGPAELKQATATQPYTRQLSASGGTEPYSFALQEGAPPAGITLTPAGELSGTTPETGSSTFTVVVTDSSTPAMTATRTYTLNVQLNVEPRSFQPTRVSALVDQQLHAAGGSGSYEFSLLSPLPAGIKLYTEGLTPTVVGSTSKAGDYTFAIKAVDTSSGAIGTRTYKLHVGLSVNPAFQWLPEGYLGQSFHQDYQAEGGSGSYTYELSTGTLPEGVEIVPKNAKEASLVGTPTTAGAYRFTVTAKDTETGFTGRQNYFLRIHANGFPRGELVLEEKDHEGNFRGSDTLDFAITSEPHGLVKGFMHDAARTYGLWTYNPSTKHIHLEWPEEAGPSGFYEGTCEPVAETCSGEGPFGPFTLGRSTTPF